MHLAKIWIFRSTLESHWLATEIKKKDSTMYKFVKIQQQQQLKKVANVFWCLTINNRHKGNL